MFRRSLRHHQPYNKQVVLSVTRILPDDGTVSVETCSRYLVYNTHIQLYVCIYLEN